MGRLFGTDGVRGLANGDLTPELALSVAVAAARVLVESDGSHQPLAIVGRDPRASGEMLEAAVVAGLTSAGANVVRVGVLPTPAVAYLVGAGQRRPRRDALRLAQPDAGQRHQALRRRRARSCPTSWRSGSRRRSPTGTAWSAGPTGAGDRPGARPAGRRRALHQAPGRRRRRTGWTGIKVVVDCANGAASEVGPTAYEEAGAEVIAIHAEPGRPQHQRQLRLDPPRGGARGRARRTAPTWASPTTATPTAAWRSPRPATWSTATRSWRSWRWPCATPAR